jgi:hypothetical protein
MKWFGLMPTPQNPNPNSRVVGLRKSLKVSKIERPGEEMPLTWGEREKHIQVKVQWETGSIGVRTSSAWFVITAKIVRTD